MSASYRERMSGDHDTVPSRAPSRAAGAADRTVPAELTAHPGRAAIVSALLDGRALPVSVLAGEAGVATSTVRAHLARLADAGVVRERQQGRHRYYELASPQAARAWQVAAGPVRSRRPRTRAAALRTARTCYDHAAGRLGVMLMRSLLDQGALAGGDGRHHPRRGGRDRLSAPGHDVDYRITERGWDLFTRLGVEVPAGRRALVRYCVDWTEQRHHLAGAAGAALLSRFEQADWVRHDVADVPRALRITDAGTAALAEHFGIDSTRLDLASAA